MNITRILTVHNSPSPEESFEVCVLVTLSCCTNLQKWLRLTLRHYTATVQLARVNHGGLHVHVHVHVQ